MQSFLHKLKSGFHFNPRTLMLSLICLAAIVSSAVFTGISSFASRVEIYDDGQFVKSVLTNTQTADAILQNEGITVSPNDEVIYKENDDTHATIRINRAFFVSIQVDNTDLSVPMVKGTVKQALEKSNVFIGDMDIVNVFTGDMDIVSENLDAEVTEDTSIQIIRVSTDLVSVEEEIPYNTVTKETSQLPEGVTQVQMEGKTGVKTNYYSCTYEDGVEVSRTEEPVTSEVSQEPVDEVILVGTLKQASAATSSGISELALPADVTLDANGIPTNYANVITGRGVAYTANAGALTSTGRTVMPGYVAVNPNIIPYGTRMYIVSTDGTVYGYAIAADTGGSCMANEILVDLFMYSITECRAWGSRTVNIYILP